MFQPRVNRGSFPVGRRARQGERRGSGWISELNLKRGGRSYAYKVNSIYRVGRYYYETDPLYSRVVHAYGTLCLISADRGPQQAKVGKMVRPNGDDGGHLFASMYFGSGHPINMVPMDKNVNRSGGAWYAMEQDFKQYLREGYIVFVDIKLFYRDGSVRPARFEITCSRTRGLINIVSTYRINNP